MGERPSSTVTSFKATLWLCAITPFPGHPQSLSVNATDGIIPVARATAGAGRALSTMEIMEFQYETWFGFGFAAVAVYLALRVALIISSRSPSVASAPHLLGTVLIALVLGWIGLDYLTWRAEFNERGVAVFRKGLPAGVQTLFTQPSHSIRWAEVSAARFSPGRRGRGGTDPSLVITGAGGTIDFPIEALPAGDARRLLSLLASCSPDFAGHSLVEETDSFGSGLWDPLFFQPRMLVSRGLSEGEPCPGSVRR